VGAGILVLIPIVALMWVPSYAKATPRLWGFPFFYWYQLMWLFIGASCVISAYLLLTRGPAARGPIDRGPIDRGPAARDERSDR